MVLIGMGHYYFRGITTVYENRDVHPYYHTMSTVFSSHRSEIDVVVDNFKSDKINGLEYLEIPSLRIIYGSNKLEEEVKVTKL
jgi:hypothetical protein